MENLIKPLYKNAACFWASLDYKFRHIDFFFQTRGSAG